MNTNPATSGSRILKPRLLALLVCAAAAVFAVAGWLAYRESRPATPQRACRLVSPPGTLDLWSVCGDTVQDDPGEIGAFTAVGNVTIGLEPSSTPIIRIGNPGFPILGTLTYGTNPLLGRKTAILIGEIGFQAQHDEYLEFLTGSGYLIDPDTGEVLSRSDLMEWDIVKGRISNTVPELHDHLDGPIGSTFDLMWADISGVQGTNFWGSDLTMRDQLSMTIDLYSRSFTATMPVTLSVNGDPADDIKLGFKVIFSETSFLTGGLNDISPKVGPAVLDLSNITLRKGEFEAALAELSIDKNPDLAMLADPAPPKPGVVVGFSGLKYKDRKWSISGTEVSIRDLTLGDAVTMRQNKLGIEYQGGQALLKIRSTLDFNNYLTTTNPLTAEVRFGVVTTTVNNQQVLKPYFDGGIAAFTGGMGPLSFDLTNVKLQGDPANNFYGLNAQTVTARWSSVFGGQSQGGLSGLKLGVDKTKKFKFEFNGGSLQSPPVSTGVFSGTQLSGNIGSISNTVNMTFTGNIVIKLPGGAKDGNGNSVNPAVSLVVRAGKNVRADCTAAGAPNPCYRRLDGMLSAFTIKLAGFKLALATVRPIGDGGFEVGQATLSLPVNFGGGANSPGVGIAGFKMKGNGDVQITGGDITLPPLKVAGMSFASFHGGFSTQMVSVNNQQVKAYSFSGGATLTLPGLEPSADKSISVSAKVVAIPSTNDIDEVDATLTFESHPGIPIASSGVELTKFTGGVNFKSSTVTFTLGIGVDSTARIPPTGAGIPIVAMNGTATVRPDPFSMSLGAQLKILIFQVASAQMQIGSGAGFNTCPPGTPSSTPVSQCPRGKGFYASFNVDALFLHGSGQVRVGKVNNVRKFSGNATLNFGLEKGQFGFGLPRKDRVLTGISFAAGEFDVPGTSANTVGMKGTFEILGFNYSMFVNFNKSLGSNGFVVFDNNLDQYQQVNAAAVAASLARGAPGFSQSAPLGRGALGTVGPPTLTVPLAVQHTADAYFGLHYTGTVETTPIITLTYPCGGRGFCVITPSTPFTDTYLYDIDLSTLITKGNDVGYVIKNALPTTYTMNIAFLPADYQIVFYVANNKPQLQHVKTGSSSVNQQLTSSTLTMVVTDTDNPGAVFTLGYARVDTATDTLIEGAVTPLFTTTQQGTISHTWVMANQVPSGVYRWTATGDDGRNAPVIWYDTRNLTVTDSAAPAPPSGLNIIPLPRSVQVNWNTNNEKDLAGYEIGYGPTANPNDFIYLRDMGAKELSEVVLARGAALALPNTVDGVVIASQFDGKVWGLNDADAVFVGVRSYDESGNYSPWTVIPGAPWVLSPQATSPAPGYSGTVAAIEASFSVPLTTTGLLAKIELRDAGNTLITGTAKVLHGLNDDEVIGLRFTPNMPMPPGAYAGRLVGGPSGVAALAGSTMPADFNWTWIQTNTLAPPRLLFVPSLRN